MTAPQELTDAALLRELGERLAATRISLGLTQAVLAEQAGISKRTIERLESGEAATHLSGFLRVCRVLGLLDRLDLFVPAPTPSPMQQLKLQGKTRQRVRTKQRADDVPAKWTWSES